MKWLFILLVFRIRALRCVCARGVLLRFTISDVG